MIWQTLKKWLRQLFLCEGLPKAIVEVDGVGVSTSGQKLEGGGVPSRPHHSIKPTEISLEERARREFLPKPTTRRRIIPHRERIPARNVDLSKHFKGKGKGQHRSYRRSVKQRVQIEEN